MLRRAKLVLTASTVFLLSAAGCSGSDEVGGGAAGGRAPTTSSGEGGSGGILDPSSGPGGAGAGGAGQGGAPFECGKGESKASLEKLPADLIIAVDNSDSMALEAAQVKAHMNTLVGAITASGIDAHVIVISKGSNNTIFDQFDAGVCLPAPVGSGSCPGDENLPGYRHVFQEVDSHDALAQIIATYDDWKGSLRPNATKTFLVVSDDESAMSAQDFTSALAQLNPPITDFKFNAIVASDEGLVSCPLCAVMGCSTCTNPCCDKQLGCFPISQEKGQTYIDLQTQSQGVYGNLCQQNFAPVFNDMATAVIQHTPIACHFDVPQPPNGVVVATETNVDFLPNPQAVPQSIYNVPSAQDCTINGGWYFDNNTSPNVINLCPATCTLLQQSTEGEVHVKFGCKTETIPS